MKDAFISYRRGAGYPVARLIRDQLEARGIYCYLDLEEDRAGKFNESLLQAIDTAPNFIIIETKNVFDRCKNEDDWVRRELLEALRNGKTIIPIRCPGFIWPEKLSPFLPDEINQMKTQQGVLFSEEYLDATVEKIISYMTGVSSADRKSEAAQVPLKTSEFFEAALKQNTDISSVDMAFHAGAEWRRDTGKIDLLNLLINKKITLRVIVNDSGVIEDICAHMRQPLKKYTSFESNVSEWAELAEQYPESVKLRIATVPLFHRLYIVRNEDGTGNVNIKYYSYGNYASDKDARQSFSSNDREYGLYTDEFDYIWKYASKNYLGE